MQQLLKKLNEPFPESNSFKDDFCYIVGVGIFVTLFLYLLRPFGIHSYHGDPFWVCATFGGITIVVASAYEFFCTYILKLQKDVPAWTLGKWILFTMGLISVIGISNYLFLVYKGWISTDWAAFMQIFLGTVFIGIFPIVLSGMLIQMNAYQRNQVQAKNLQAAFFPPATKVHTFMFPYKNDYYAIPMANLFYVEAMQNYVSVCHLKEGKIEKMMFRNTIKNMALKAENTPLIRCHRSFIVNTTLIKKVAGNAQGLRLTLKDLPDFEVPVSRKYIPALKERIS